MDFKNCRHPVIAAHRGDKEHFPENTMAAFESAVKLGADMVETDIHLTKDKKLILMHDHNLDRSTNGTGPIREATFDEISKLNAGTEEFPAKVPTLEEFIKFAAPYENLLLDLEIKVYLNDEGEERMKYTIEETVKLCRKYHIEHRVMINSFDAAILEYVNKNYPGQFVLHGFYPYDKMFNKTVNPEEYLDYACYWAEGEESEQNCKYLLSKGILPCICMDMTKEIYDRTAGCGCAMFTENDPKKFLDFRG